MAGDAPGAMVTSREVTVRGLLRGRELAGRWRATVAGSALTLLPHDAMTQGAVTIPVASVDGAWLEGDVLVVCLSGGDALELSEGEGLDELVTHLDEIAFQVGEVMRTARTSAARRAAPGTLHDRFLEPFLAARLQLATVGDPAACLEAAGARALRGAVNHLLDAFSAERFPESPPDRRALRAELEEHAAPLMRALDALEAAATAARQAAPQRRYVSWRTWTAALAATFAQAEEAWLALAPALATAAAEAAAAEERDASVRRSRLRRWRA